MNDLLYEEKLRLRRGLLCSVSDVKRSIDLLLNKGFFRALLSFYEGLEGINGLPEWMELYSSLDGGIDDCEGCVSGKLRLLEKLVFELNESKLLSLLDELAKKRDEYEEV